MADFVAVIRRAVDGLANNTPEMRVRVYEKARSAVQRQLENMKPRPSDEMLRRQLEKLDAAIAAVEAEHAEALPPEPAAPVPPVAAAAAYAAPEESAEEDLHSEPQPVDEQPVEPAAHDAEADDRLPQDYPEPETVAEPYAPAPDHAYPQDEPTDAVSPASDPFDAQTDGEPLETEPVADVYSPAPSQPSADPFGDEPQAAEAAPQDDGSWSSPEPVYEPVPEPLHEPAYEPVTEQPEEPAVEPAAAPVVDWRAEEAAPAMEPVAHEHREVVYDQASYHEHVDSAPDIGPEETAVETEAVPYGTGPVVEPAADVLADFDQPRSNFARARSEWPDAPSTAPIVSSDPYLDEPAPAAETNDWYLPEATVEADHRLAESQPPADEPAQGASEPDWAMPAEIGMQTAAARDAVEPEDIFSAHFDDEQHATAQARMPAVSDLPDLTAPPARSAEPDFDEDPLGVFLQPTATTAKIAPAPADADDPWNDLEELIGYDRNADGTVAAGGSAAGARDGRADSAELEALMAAPVAKSYRIKPKPKRSYAVILLAVLGLALLGGGGYAIWMNRSALNSLVGNGAGPEASGTATPAANPGATAQTSPTAPATTPAANGGSAPAATPAATPGKPAGPTKFTQRLLADGTEVDQGSGGPQASASGQSVAQLNAPPAEPAAGQPANGAAAQASPPATSPTAPAQTPAEAPALAGQKIFLYEERVGQSTPIAVEGTVSWSLQNESGENGRPEPVVQGRINIPDRGLTALVTFKRNTDASLPASHLVEFVFSLPKDFEGGAIDSVSRISMKSTEQDRGDPLIAVPAKITADFHMVALNDFPDARARNMELLRTRNWMDVPLVYNTGRRALLTMQKGPDGTKAFDEAIREWGALAPQQGQ
jgi:hypothetical protein